MASAPTTDWAWPALIASLQHDIAQLRGAMDEARRETSTARELHRRELDALIEQLRDMKRELGPIVEERNAAKEARRDILWGWIGKGGWALIATAVAIFWHWITRHHND